MSNANQVEPCGESDVYREEILDHSRNPRNKRRMDDATVKSRKANMSCGDTVEWFVKVEDGRLTEISFDGVGCAISMGATSMLTEEVLGKTVEDVLKMEKEDVFELLGTEVGPARIRCAMLGLEALKKGLSEK